MAAYFVCDYFTLKDKEDGVIGGIDYFYTSLKDNFSDYASKSFYTNKQTYPEAEVVEYNIISFSPSKVTIDDLEDNNYYNVLVSITFDEEIENFDTNINVTIIEIDNRFYVCGVDNA